MRVALRKPVAGRCNHPPCMRTIHHQDFYCSKQCEALTVRCPYAKCRKLVALEFSPAGNLRIMVHYRRDGKRCDATNKPPDFEPYRV